MMAKELEGLEGKEFIFHIRWVVDCIEVLTDGTEEYMEKLREIGEAAVEGIEIQEAKK